MNGINIFVPAICLFLPRVFWCIVLCFCPQKPVLCSGEPLHCQIIGPRSRAAGFTSPAQPSSISENDRWLVHLHRGGDVPLLRHGARTTTRGGGGASVLSGIFGLPPVIGGARRGGGGGSVHLPSLLLGGQVGPVLLGSQPVVVVADVEWRGLLQLLTQRVHLELGRRGRRHRLEECSATHCHLRVVWRVAEGGRRSSRRLGLRFVRVGQRLAVGGKLVGHALFDLLPSEVIDF